VFDADAIVLLGLASRAFVAEGAVFSFSLTRPPKLGGLFLCLITRGAKGGILKCAHSLATGSVIIVFAILNGIFWLVDKPRLHDLNVFSAGFVLGMLGMYIAAWLYGYRRIA
jgi:hypothetical protein